MKAVPEDRRESDENDQRKDEIIQELTDEGRNIGLHTVGELAIGVFMKGSADHEIQGIVDDGGSDKGDRTADKNKPRAAENAVKRAVIVRIRGNTARNEKDQAGQKVDHHRQNGDHIRGLRSEMLREDIHAHEGEPGDQDTAVKRDPFVLEKRLICQQIHADDADNEECDRDRGNRLEQDRKLLSFSLYFFFYLHF